MAASADTELTLQVRDTADPTPTDLPATNVPASARTPDVQSCSLTTTGKPDLFEIRTDKNSAILYFAPPPAPFTSFYIAYSTKSDSDEYGVEYEANSTGGVQKYTIYLLEPKTKYYFKIRAGNGCSTGMWSNVMSATTTTGSQMRTSYKYFVTAVIKKINSTVGKILQSPQLLISKEIVATPPAIIEPTVIRPISNQVEAIATPLIKPKRRFCFLWWCFVLN